MRQWEIWKGRPEGFAKDHWFVIISGQERLNHPHLNQVNGPACWTLRGELGKTDVYLNSSDGFSAPTSCQCDLLYFLDKRKLHSPAGSIGFERQLAIKSKVKEVLRF